MDNTKTLTTDARSRTVISGHPNKLFVVREFPDGSILLEPARVVTDAQHAYDTDPWLRDLLDTAMASPTVKKKYRRRR